MTYADYLFVFGIFLVFALTVWFQQKAFFDRRREEEKAELEKEVERLKAALKQKDKELITPVRLQAYERAVLLLERISPQSLIFRVQRPGQNVLQLQTTLLQTIRDEFEHNLSQQLYISKEAWAMVKTAKEEMVKMINTAAAKVQPEQPGTELSKAVFNDMASKKLTTESAVAVLKNEIQKLF